MDQSHSRVDLLGRKLKFHSTDSCAVDKYRLCSEKTSVTNVFLLIVEEWSGEFKMQNFYTDTLPTYLIVINKNTLAWLVCKTVPPKSIKMTFTSNFDLNNTICDGKFATFCYEFISETEIRYLIKISLNRTFTCQIKSKCRI